jgi:D-3-phosphoglycerate dehydrogenase / 2-oxoglutarate reductase
MSLRILHLETECYPVAAIDRLRELGDLRALRAETQGDLLRHLRDVDYDAIFTRLGLSIDAEVLELQPSLRWIVTPTTGVNHIDTDLAEHHGVQVISLRGETDLLRRIPSTAEHTWALLLALVRRLPSLHASVLRGHWQREGQMAAELEGRTLGILGFGRLGRMVSRYGSAFGMEVMKHDRERVEGTEYVSLDDLLRRSDVLSVHITGTPENHGFLNADRLGRMKAGALLINTARGEVVDEAALLERLEGGKLAGAALDVLSGDSAWDRHVPEDHPLVAYARTHDNLILTPHTGGYGRESIFRTRAFVADRFVRAIIDDKDGSICPS